MKSNKAKEILKNIGIILIIILIVFIFYLIERPKCVIPEGCDGRESSNAVNKDNNGERVDH